MIKDNELLTIFVAMPETKQSMGGQSIPWPDPEAIEKSFFKRIALKLEQDLQSEVILHIKKYGHLVEDIPDSTSSLATRQPSIYIADLTGNNANVYLELGIRWALKNSVTVLVSQTITDVKFNAANAHVIAYSNDPPLLERAIDKVVKAIKDGLAKEKYIDTLILSKDHIIKAEIKGYQNKIEQLEEQVKTLTQSKKILDSAKIAKIPEERIALYQSAIRANPTLMEAYLPLALEQRKQGQYADAVATLKQAIALFPANTEFYREQGITYNKKGQFEEAIQAFRTAVSLNDADDEAWSNLGGLLRAIGTKSTSYNWNALREARDCYQKALKTNDRNAYAQGNLARLDLMLSKVDPERFYLAMKEFYILEALCRLDLNAAPKDYWRWFDRADSYLLTGKVDEGYHLYTKAIELVPLEHRKSELSSVIAPLTNFLSLGVLSDDAVKTAVQKVVETLQALISGQISHAKFSSGGASTEEQSVSLGRTQLLLE